MPTLLKKQKCVEAGVDLTCSSAEFLKIKLVKLLQPYFFMSSAAC